MAPKKGKAKKAKSVEETKESDILNATDVVVPEEEPLVIPDEVVNWVTLDMKLLNWGYMNFKLTVKTTTPLFAIKKQICLRHGRIADLRICKEQFSERNEMLEEMRTLQDYGIPGAEKGQKEVIFQLCYDFKPCGHDDPLLLVTES